MERLPPPGPPRADEESERLRARVADLEARLLAATGAAPASADFVSHHGVDGTFRAVTDTCRALLGYAPDELVGRSSYAFMHPDDAALVRRNHALAVGGALFERVTYRLRHKDGHYVWVETASAPRPERPDGAPAAFVFVTRDVSQRYALREALEAAEAARDRTNVLFSAIIGASDDLVAVFSPELRLEVFNASYARHMRRIFGRRVQPGMHVSELMEGRRALDVDHVRGALERALGGERHAVAYHVPTHRGARVHLDGTFYPVCDDRGQILAAAHTLRDTTRALEDEREASARRALMASLLDSAPFGMGLVELTDDDGILVLSVNDTTCRQMGMSAAELEGKPATSPPGRLVVWVDAYRESLATRQPVRIAFGMGDRAFTAVVNYAYTTPEGRPRFSYVMSDETGERAQAAELEERRLFVEGVAASMPDVLYVYDLPTRANVYANRGLDAVLGYAPEDVRAMGAAFHALLIHPDDAARAAKHYVRLRSLAPGETADFAYRMRARDGAYRWLWSRETPLHYDAEGHVTQVVGVAQDVTARREAEEALGRYAHDLELAKGALEANAAELRETIGALEGARDAAEAAARAKSAFLATMSHELRTPMNGVLGMTEILGTLGLTPEQRECVDTIRTSGQGLCALINDLLDFSQVEAGSVRLERRPFELRATVQSALAATLAGPGVACSARVADAVPERVVGDEGRVRQVLSNLLSNAAKFTHDGHIAVEVDVDPDEPAFAGDGAGGVALRFSVRDTGIGIAPGTLPGLFEPFTQGDDSTTRRYGGAGLGLSICRSLCALMGGRISATSTPGEGSTFSFTVRLGLPGAEPVPAAVRPAPARAAPARVAAPARPPRALVADVSPAHQRVAIGMLRRLGYEVDVASDRRGALAALERGEHDVVLVDLQMPGVDGIETARRLRQGAARGSVRLVAVTADPLDDDRAACLAAGMDGYLAKPLAIGALAAALGRTA